MPNGRNVSVADGTEPDSIANKAEFSDHILATGAGAWRPIETLPEFTDALVCVTHNVPGENGMEWETVMWVDWWCEGNGWYAFPQLIHIPFPPTQWMPLPPAPEVAP